jgi:transcriptional regulator with XRE-family HTH domain
MLESAPRLLVYEDDIKPVVQGVQEKNEPTGKLFILSVNQTDIWERIKEAFETDKVQGIADKLGLSYQSVRKWKNGEQVGLDNLLKIRDLTGSSIDWLLTGEGSKEVGATQNDTATSKGGKLLQETSLSEIFTNLFERVERLEASLPAPRNPVETPELAYFARTLGVTVEAVLYAEQRDPVLFKKMQRLRKELADKLTPTTEQRA